MAIHTGRIQELNSLRHRKKGLYVGDDEGNEVLLPITERPDNGGDVATLRVFVHRNTEGQQVATLRMPKAQAGEFALLKMSAIRGAVARLDWGVDAELLVTHAEQERPMEEGRYYVVHVALAESTHRLFASSRVGRFLDNTELTLKEMDEVTLKVFDRSELGLHVIVNITRQGLVHAGEVFKHASIGDRITGYVMRVREDSKLDIVLQTSGYRQCIDAHTALLGKHASPNAMESVKPFDYPELALLG